MTARGSAARRRGITFEQEVARWFGTSTTRNTRPGIHDDAGDVVLPGFVVECKAWTRSALPLWWRELIAKCGDDDPLLIVKAGHVRNALVYEQDTETGLWADPVTLAEWWPK